MEMPLPAFRGFKFGCDPELFVMDDKGRYVSAEPFIPGTKANPEKVPGGAVQLDGVAAEFNIDPVEDFAEFNNNIVKVMGKLKSFLPKGYSLDARAAVTFDEDVWDKISPEAKMLGCTPDFNAWTGDVNPTPDGDAIPRMRTASGHIHIGWTDDEEMDNIDHINNCRDLAKQLDWFLGAWSLQADPDPTRRKLYGKAGAIRYKPYGVEYRTLSNFWVKDKLSRLRVWNRLQAALSAMQTTYMPEKYGHDFNQAIIKMINTSTREPVLENHFNYPLVQINRLSRKSAYSPTSILQMLNQQLNQQTPASDVPLHAPAMPNWGEPITIGPIGTYTDQAIPA